MAHRLSWLLLIGAACSSGSTVDVQLTANGPVRLSQLTLTLDTTGVVHHKELDLDGGANLPATLRVLADGDSLQAAAEGFDDDGGYRANTAQLTLENGKTQTLTLDLSKQAWCPAGPLAPGEIALYGEDGHDASVFGYADARFVVRHDPALACTGSVSAEYVATTQWDGMGLVFPAPTQYRHVSIRVWVSTPSHWVITFVHNQNEGYVFPDPATCNTNEAACAFLMGPTGQR